MAARGGSSDHIIHLVSPMWPSRGLPYWGIFVQVVAEGLEDLGWTVDRTAVCTSNHSGLLGRIERHLGLPLGLMRIWTRRPRIIYAHSPTWYSWLILAIQRTVGTAVIINLHGSEFHSRSWVANAFWPITCRAIRAADLVVSPSQAFVDVIEAEAGRPRDQIMVSPSGGVKPSRFFVSPEAVNRPMSHKVVGFCSRISPGKRWRFFLDIVERMVARDPTVRAVMAGGGEEREALTQEIERRGLSSIVNYRGALPQAELQQLYSEMDVFLFTSAISGVDTLGLVPIEAMSCGTPVVATRARITQDYVREGENGLLCEVSDLDGFVESAFACLSWERATLRERVAATVSHYATPKVVADLSARIASVAKMRGAG